MDQPRRFKIPVEWELILANALLLAPAIWFWTSVAIRLGLETDYFFDIVFENLSQSWWGNGLLITMVIFLPGVAVATNGMIYIRQKQGGARWMAILAGLFLAAGFFAAVKRS